MKKIAFLMALLACCGVSRAQWGDYGVKVGLGVATIDDDLITKSPVMGASVGGYVNYTFAQSKSVLAEIFYLQTGLNIVRRGCNFREVLQNINNMMVREGYFHSYYAQIPIIACVHMELPIREEGHVVGVFLGPTVSVGLTGVCRDRKITPTVSSRLANYDERIDVFKYLNRLDVGAQLGVTYEHRNWVVSLYIDRGFLATSTGDDIMRAIQNTQSSSSEYSKVKIPNGHNISYMLSASYALGSFSKK